MITNITTLSRHTPDPSTAQQSLRLSAASTLNPSTTHQSMSQSIIDKMSSQNKNTKGILNLIIQGKGPLML